jgi:hypothetical protein
MQTLRGAKTATTAIKKEQASRGSETIRASQPRLIVCILFLG